MNQSNSPEQINRRQSIKKASHFILGMTGAFAALGVEYSKPTLTKLVPLKQSVVMAQSNGNPPPP